MTEEIKKLIEKACIEYCEHVDSVYNEKDIFKAGANFILHQNRWRKVEEELPENNPFLINPDGITTIKVVVKSINGFYYVDHRVKSVHDNMDRTVVHWNWIKLNENQAIEWKPIE